MSSRKRFWMNKRILITGFEGFLGAHLTEALIFYGAKVTGLDIRVNRKQTIFTPATYRKIKVIKGNVANFKLVRDIINKQKIEIVFHLAAEALVERGYASPLRLFESNICGTWNILEACRLSGLLEAIVVASSDKAYGEHKRLPYKESYPLFGKHPYDVSKSCADLITNAYFYSFNLPVAVTRCGNIYGPGDFNFSRLTPDAIRCIVSNKEFLIRSDGKFTRDFIYVSDIVNGYLLLAENMRKLHLAGQAFNFSDERPINVLDFVRLIYRLTDKKYNYRILNRVKHEIKHQYLNSAKAQRILKWSPSIPLEKGLAITIDWYKSFLGI